jgi:hypothetical protein
LGGRIEKGIVIRTFLAVLVMAYGGMSARAAEARPRLIVLTDIGGDPDDQQSMIRLLLYANEFDIEGLIASASGVPGELKEPVTKPHLIGELVEAYGKVHGNLTKHAQGYPKVAHLLSCIKTGNQRRGVDAIGEGKDTEGSRWLIEVVDRPDDRPVNISIWGGQTDFAQALWRVRQDRGREGLKKFVARLRVHDIDDQDKMVEWIWEQFPGMFYILSKAAKGRDKREGAYRGMYLGGDESLASRDWMEKNIRQDHGPLGALYPAHTWTAPNPHSAIKEGDTPSWFYFLRHGVNDPEHPEWGGWGGRFLLMRDRIYTNAQDNVDGVTDGRATVWRWRPAFQAEFAARLDWCVASSFEQVSHAPSAVLNGKSSRDILRLSAKPGETVHLSAEGSRDQNGKGITMRWFVYPEAGTWREDVKLSSADGSKTSFVAPHVSDPATVHVILEVRAASEPRVSSSRRAIVEVKP